MDRKSSAKIKNKIVVWALFILMFTAVMCLFEEERADSREAQMKELNTIYPGRAEELADNFAFYKEREIKAMLAVWTAVAALSAASGILACHMAKKDRMDAQRLADREAEWIYEQLREFQKGNFASGMSVPNEESETQWRRSCELLRELAHYLEALKTKLAEEENSTKALITDISHQLKTPLASLRMSHELAKTEELSASERKEFLEAEEQEIRRLEMLLDELVNLSRLESNMVQIKPEKKGIMQTLTEAVNRVFMKAHCKDIEIAVELKEDTVLPHDAKWTAEALANVLDNAVKYSEPGSEVKVRCEQLPGNLLIEIEDEGIGIEEDEIHRIFQRFYRGSNARRYEKEGAGVGLYLARSIFERQGGTITAKRKMERGTIFKITLSLPK